MPTPPRTSAVIELALVFGTMFAVRSLLPSTMWRFASPIGMTTAVVVATRRQRPPRRQVTRDATRKRSQAGSSSVISAASATATPIAPDSKLASGK